MAVISELIDVGLSLKDSGNHQSAIEHFRQLHQTYPDHARIMFELAGSWQLFGVPEQALPLYRRLMAMPKSQGLSVKDMPRLYTQMGASLRLLGQFTESLEIIEEGLSLYPDYRPLRAYRMFALHSSGHHQNAMLDALDLMLESLAPSKWDLYEDEILKIVESIRERVPEPNTDNLEEWVFDEYWTDEASKSDEKPDEDDETVVLVDDVLDEATAITNGEDVELIEEDPSPTASVEVVSDGKIEIEDSDTEDEAFEVEVKVIKQDKPKQTKPAKTTRKDDDNQFGKKPVKIDINSSTDADTPDVSVQVDEPETTSDDDKPAAASGKINIPIDLD